MHAHTFMADECKSWGRFTARLPQTRANARGEEGGRGSGRVSVFEGEGRGRKGGGTRSGSSLENLHAMVECVSHDHAPVAVDGDAAKRGAELHVA